MSIDTQGLGTEKESERVVRRPRPPKKENEGKCNGSEGRMWGASGKKGISRVGVHISDCAVGCKKVKNPYGIQRRRDREKI